MSQERFLQLLSRKMAGEATVQELGELEKLMLENAEWKIFTEQVMINHPETTVQDEHEADAAFAAHSAKMQLTGRLPAKKVTLHRRRNLVKWTMRLAAILIIGVAVASIYTFNRLGKKNNPATQREQQPETIVTQKGSRSRTLLADGTTVWLNAGSKLTYENDFNGATREVRLEGEAFFDVVKQSQRLFIVHTSGIDISVLGTTFNVKSYPDDKNVEITLYKGSIQVLRKDVSSGKAIRLIPNHKLILPKKGATESVKLSEEEIPFDKRIPEYFIIAPIDSIKKESDRVETAWVYNRLEFENESFAEAAKKMERWYDVRIVFTDDKVKDLRITGMISNETVEQAFAALKEAFPINYTIKNHEVLVELSQEHLTR